MSHQKTENRKDQSNQGIGRFADRSGINFRCPHCAGALQYSIQDQKMRCEQCDGLFPVRAIQDPTAPAQEGEPVEMETVEYRCPSCGASLHTTRTGTTSFCSFCGSDVVLTERVSRIRRPDRIVPFTTTREQCAELYRKRIRESPLVPDNMRTKDAADRFRPVYIPFWCISGKGDGTYTRLYSEDIGEGNQIRTDTYEEDRKGTVSVYNILYDACTQFDDETAQWLQLRSDKAVPFHPAYLSGFYAESADTESNYFQNLARDYATECLENSSQSLPVNFRQEAKLILMPVWLLPSKQGEKVVYTAVSGDGYQRIRCELPVSPGRFALMMGLLAILITALVLVLHNYILLRPQITAGLGCLLAAFCWNAAAPFLEKVHMHNRDDDPTRAMLRKAKEKDARDIHRYLHLGTNEETSEPGYVIPLKKIGIYAVIAFAALAVITLGSSNRLRTTNSLISDNSFLPAVLAALSGFLLIKIWRKHNRMSVMDVAAFISQICLCGMLILLRLFSAGKELYYLLALVSIVITLLVLLNAFRRHNQYVSRPVPFFDREEDA